LAPIALAAGAGQPHDYTAERDLAGSAMSFRGDDSAIPDRLRLDYAPTSRATCKGCGGGISEGEVRCGVKVRSSFHDGFEMKWHHAKCGLRQGATGPGSFKGFQRLRWADQAALAESLKQPLDLSKPCVARAKRINEMVWQVYDLIAAVPKKSLREALELNGCFLDDKMSPFELGYTIADRVVNRMLPACPFCQCMALVGEGGQIRCAGFAAGASSCTLCVVLEPVFGEEVASQEMRDRVGRLQTRFELTPPLARALKKWSLPPDAPACALAGAGGAAPSGTASSGAAPSGSAGDGAASEDEPEPPAGMVMAGLTVSSVGSPTPGADELQRLVESHGGEWVTGSIGDGSCLNLLVATPAEINKKKRAVKLTAALDKKVPVVSADYILALAGLAPEGETGGPRPAAGTSAGGTGEAGQAAPGADGMDADSVASMKVPEIKAQLKERDLSCSGNKPALVERLRLAMQAEAAARSEQVFVAARAGVAGACASSDAVAAPEPPPPKRARTEAGASAAALPGVRGAALRQRKHMTPYLLLPEAGAGPRLPSLATAIDAKKAADKRKQATQKPPRQMLPPVALGSALATVGALR
jgi:poly [ADP-ribose] polymerase